MESAGSGPPETDQAATNWSDRFLLRADTVRKIRIIAKARWIALTVMLSRIMNRGSAS
jgi:hypothetical protein